jgi:hypothetical protein
MSNASVKSCTARVEGHSMEVNQKKVIVEPEPLASQEGLDLKKKTAPIGKVRFLSFY